MAATPLAEDEIVYRALLRKQWIDPDTHQVKADAFFLRVGRDNDGLSVFRAKCRTPEECASRFNTCFGVAEIQVASVRTLGLDVVHGDEDQPEHALIVGLPTTEDDRAKAERLASLLAKQARLVK